MAYEFQFPDVGEGIHEGKIVKWLVKEGDTIQADESLAEVETDKAIVEIPSPKTGKILKITHKEGDVIKVGEILASIEEDAASAAKSAKASANGTEKRESTGVVGALEATGAGVMKAPSLNLSGAVFSTNKPGDTEVRSKAAVGGINVPKAGIKAVKKYDMFGYIDRAPYNGVRKAVGDHMVQSVSKIPHVTHTDMADVTNLLVLRESQKKEAETKGIKLTFLPYIIKAAAQALQEFPALNAMLNEEEGQIIFKKYYNIGIAVDTEAGLMVPVLKGADKKGVLDIAKEVAELAEKSRTRKINPMDFKGGTFTITNVGSAGGWFFTPVINYPESAILGIGFIQDMAVPVAAEPSKTTKTGKTAKAAAPAIEARKMLPLSLSFDHRILDGATAARFTAKIKELLQKPQAL